MPRVIVPDHDGDEHDDHHDEDDDEDHDDHDDNEDHDEDDELNKKRKGIFMSHLSMKEWSSVPQICRLYARAHTKYARAHTTSLSLPPHSIHIAAVDNPGQ